MYILKLCKKIFITIAVSALLTVPVMAMGSACKTLPKQNLSREEIYNRLIDGYYDDGKDTIQESHRFFPPDYMHNDGKIIVAPQIYDASKNTIVLLKNEGIVRHAIDEIRRYTGLDILHYNLFSGQRRADVVSLLVPKEYWKKVYGSNYVKETFFRGGARDTYEHFMNKNIYKRGLGFNRYNSDDGYTSFVFSVQNLGIHKTLEKNFIDNYFRIFISNSGNYTPSSPSVLNGGTQTNFSTFDKYLLCAKYSDVIPRKIKKDIYLEFITDEILKLQKQSK